MQHICIITVDLDTDEHLPGEPRILGTVALQVDFAKSFSCPKNTPLNPEKKCFKLNEDDE